MRSTASSAWAAGCLAAHSSMVTSRLSVNACCMAVQATLDPLKRFGPCEQIIPLGWSGGDKIRLSRSVSDQKMFFYPREALTGLGAESSVSPQCHKSVSDQDSFF